MSDAVDSFSGALTALLRHRFFPGQHRIVDAYGRTFTYLRISVTDHCNLRCVYCMPPEGMQWLPSSEVLRFEEIERVVEAAAACGVHKIRITGGEPMVRKEIVKLVGMIAAVPGIDDLALTTNGILLERYAEDLAAAGLNRINISLDTLDPGKFREITRTGRLDDVLSGLAVAERTKLSPVKLNMVVLGGLNDDEVAAFAEMTLTRSFEVRFIEYMPLAEAKGCALGSGSFSFVSNDVTKARIEKRLGSLVPLEVGEHMRGPAEVWQLSGARGKLGFISAMSAPFCRACDRLRLTCTGELRSCLLDGGGVEIRSLLRGQSDPSAQRNALIAAFEQAAQLKPDVHKAWDEIPAANMSRIGG